VRGGVREQSEAAPPLWVSQPRHLIDLNGAHTTNELWYEEFWASDFDVSEHLSSLPGLKSPKPVVPPMNRWAKTFRPWGDCKSARFIPY
jgi:hypothetical protein